MGPLGQRSSSRTSESATRLSYISHLEVMRRDVWGDRTHMIPLVLQVGNHRNVTHRVPCSKRRVLYRNAFFVSSDGVHQRPTFLRDQTKSVAKKRTEGSLLCLPPLISCKASHPGCAEEDKLPPSCHALQVFNVQIVA